MQPDCFANKLSIPCDRFAGGRNDGGLQDGEIDCLLAQIQAGLLGRVLQAVLVPFIVMGLRLLLLRDKSKQ